MLRILWVDPDSAAVAGVAQLPGFAAVNGAEEASTGWRVNQVRGRWVHLDAVHIWMDLPRVAADFVSGVAAAAFNNLGRPGLSTWFNWGKATLGTIPFATAGATPSNLSVLTTISDAAQPWVAIWAVTQLPWLAALSVAGESVASTASGTESGGGGGGEPRGGTLMRYKLSERKAVAFASEVADYAVSADGTLHAHTSEIPTARYKKGHRHGGGAHIIILAGEGYSLMWPDDDPWVKVDWKPGAFFCAGTHNTINCRIKTRHRNIAVMIVLCN